jgi:2-methylisocitrate lyase-like PEP mutase family enzyme
MTTPAAALRGLIARPVPPKVPLVLDPLCAVTAQAAGFEALYLGGGTMGYVKTSTEAHLSVTQMCQSLLEIRAACPLPVILDGQCGWGDAMHMHHTIRMVEAAGAAAIEIEDQLMPKRAHHHIGIEHLIPTEHMAEKIRVAVAARRDPDFVIIGRTNACRTDGFDEAVRRAEVYRKAGADMLLVLPKDAEQARSIGERVEGPLFYLMLGGPQSMGMTPAEMGALGYRLLVDPLTPFYARHTALRLCYEALAKGENDPSVGNAYREETSNIHELIGLSTLLEIERRTVER